MNIVGVDPSLTATGLCHPGHLETLHTKTSGCERLAYIRDEVAACIVDADLVVLEDYAFGKVLGMARLGELGGVLRLMLWESGTPFVNVNPTGLKRYATGRGNAPKDEVLVAAVNRFAPVALHPADNNQADAMWLWAMGMDALGEPPVAMPAAHRKALDAVPWPALA